MVKGTQGEVNYLISPKSSCIQFYRLLEYQLNDGKNPQLSNENPREYSDSADGNLT